MTPLISIIVPIYKVEPYLRKCVDSIIAQTYQNLEIILVDDGSPDGCPQICDDYKEKDSRVKVIHKKNGGLSDARNAGLNIATGEYVTFIDSDDWYADDAIEIMVSLFFKYDISIACMKNVSVSSDYSDTEKANNTKRERVMPSHKLLRKICNKKYSTAVWNKLFRRSMWENHRFIYGRLNEDYLCLCEMLMGDFRIATIEYAGYFYYSRTGSITHDQDVRYRSVRDAVKNALELKEKASRMCPQVEKHFARMALYQARTLLFLIPDDEKANNSESICLIRQCLQICSKFILWAKMKATDKLILCSAKNNPVSTANTVQKLYHKILRK